MPRSCKCILDRMVHKGAMTVEEREKILRNLKGIEWHPYPKEKPNSKKDCFITEHFGVCGSSNVVSTAWFDEGSWHWENGDVIPEDVVTAWAELPEPYEEGAEE